LPNPVTHFEITGKDAKKLQDFYQGVFDWKINNFPMPDGGSYGMVEPQEGKGIGGGVGSGDGSSGHVTFYVEVDDPDAYLKQIEQKGGKTVVPTTTVPNMVTFALFADPEGHLVGLVKSEPPH